MKVAETLVVGLLAKGLAKGQLIVVAVVVNVEVIVVVLDLD